MKEIGLSNVTEDKFTADTWSFEKAKVYISDDEYISLGGYATTLVSDMEDTEIVYGGRGTADDLKDLDVKDKLVLIEIDQHNLVSFTWETEIIFPTEQSQNNIAALEDAISALKDGNSDYAYDECLSGVDYNWYAYEFEKESFDFQTKRMRDNAVGTWGEGLILNPGENLYDVIAFLKENYGNENTDYTEVISTLEKALENQKTTLTRQ